ncbi:MAG: sulfotransferase family 2 domain-containing protein [Gammaproteobacteria bacterium]|nr:sulfotransferase family 2 domain-containing protein [Gammaproteobacteria bacterium]
MIISHRHKSIFIHIPKTAGSAVTVALAPCLGPFVIRVGALYDCLRAGVWPNFRTCLDMMHPRAIRALLRALSNRDMKMLLQAQKRRYHFLADGRAHAGADTISANYPEAWADYYRFCFVRNPFERMVSYYLWLKRRHNYRDFRAYLETVSYKPQYMLEGRVAVDFVGRYENLVADFSHVCKQIGISSADSLPIVKKGPDYSYREYYGPLERRMVEDIWGEEIERFGYSF